MVIWYAMMLSRRWHYWRSEIGTNFFRATPRKGDLLGVFEQPVITGFDHNGVPSRSGFQTAGDVL